MTDRDLEHVLDHLEHADPGTLAAIARRAEELRTLWAETIGVGPLAPRFLEPPPTREEAP